MASVAGFVGTPWPQCATESGPGTMRDVNINPHQG
jgi:hypothetical protein